MRLRPMTAIRRIAAARLADGCVRELRSRPPELLFLGASVSHEVKCFSVVHRLMSVPISAMSFKALYGARPSIWARLTPPVSGGAAPESQIGVRSRAASLVTRGSGSGVVGGASDAVRVCDMASMARSQAASWA